MGSLSIWHWLIVLAVVLVLFGGGSRLSSMMGDVGKGLRVFKRNLNPDEKDSDDDALLKEKKDTPQASQASLNDATVHSSKES